MNRIGKFEKVSFKQFHNDLSDVMKDEFCVACDMELEKDHIKQCYENVSLPTRATTHSAGYDFVAPHQIYLKPGESIKIPTGIRVQIEPGWFLMCTPKSGLGFKYKVRLANTVGIIDGDYYQSDNEGHIFCKLLNEGDATLSVAPGKSFMQGIFLPYGVTYDDEVDAIRNGGFGSTG